MHCSLQLIPKVKRRTLAKVLTVPPKISLKSFEQLLVLLGVVQSLQKRKAETGPDPCARDTTLLSGDLCGDF